MDGVREHFERWRYHCSLAEEFRTKLASFRARANLDFVISMLRSKVERALGPSGYTH